MRHPAPMPDGLPLHLDDVPTERWEIGELAATRRRLGATAGAKRLGVALTRIDPGKRSTPPHSHADEDELFLVLRGTLTIELRDGSVTLGPGEMAVIPKDVEHRPTAAEEVHLMLIEPKGIRHTGDVESELTVHEYSRI